MNRTSLALLFLLLSYRSWGQNKKLDSLYSVLQNHLQEDSVRALRLVGICYFEYTSNNEKNKILAEKHLEFQESHSKFKALSC